MCEGRAVWMLRDCSCCYVASDVFVSCAGRQPNHQPCWRVFFCRIEEAFIGLFSCLQTCFCGVCRCARRVRFGCCAIALVATLHLTFAFFLQKGNQITSLFGAVFPAGLTELYLVCFHDCRLCFVLCVCDVRGVRCGCCAIALVATLHLTSAFFPQKGNEITSLADAVFPAELTELNLVSFHDCRLVFVACVCDVRGACGLDVARLLLLRRCI